MAGMPDWDKVNNLMMRVLKAAEKVAKYRHAPDRRHQG